MRKILQTNLINLYQFVLKIRSGKAWIYCWRQCQEAEHPVEDAGRDFIEPMFSWLMKKD